jgi:hypothetical protein
MKDKNEKKKAVNKDIAYIKKNKEKLWEIWHLMKHPKTTLNSDIFCELEGENPCIVMVRCNRRKICDIRRKREFKEKNQP